MEAPGRYLELLDTVGETLISEDGKPTISALEMYECVIGTSATSASCDDILFMFTELGLPVVGIERESVDGINRHAHRWTVLLGTAGCPAQL